MTERQKIDAKRERRLYYKDVILPTAEAAVGLVFGWKYLVPEEEKRRIKSNVKQKIRDVKIAITRPFKKKTEDYVEEEL